MESLTERQQEVYGFIVEFLEGNGYSPSIQEVVDGTSLRSTSTVSYHLARLECKGWIERTPRVPRSIRLRGFERLRVGEGDLLLVKYPEGYPRMQMRTEMFQFSELLKAVERGISLMPLPDGVSVESLRVEEGDVLLVRFSGDTPYTQRRAEVYRLAESLRARERGIFILALEGDVTVECMSEEDMERLGWVSKERYYEATGGRIKWNGGR